jgi:DNA-directed RNA polymerase subunit beta'
MFSRREVTNAGDADLAEGEIVDESILQEENAKAKAAGGEIAKADYIAMGISEVSLSRKSFLSAASFQHTTRILINSAVRGSRDTLQGLMENVIIGRLIPAGSGFIGSAKHAMVAKAHDVVVDVAAAE